jgi:hypothetical protein
VRTDHKSNGNRAQAIQAGYAPWKPGAQVRRLGSVRHEVRWCVRCNCRATGRSRKRLWVLSIHGTPSQQDVPGRQLDVWHRLFSQIFGFLPVGKPQAGLNVTSACEFSHAAHHCKRAKTGKTTPWRGVPRV